jgi:hypothetical protein
MGGTEAPFRMAPSSAITDADIREPTAATGVAAGCSVSATRDAGEPHALRFEPLMA